MSVELIKIELKSRLSQLYELRDNYNSLCEATESARIQDDQILSKKTQLQLRWYSLNNDLNMREALLNKVNQQLQEMSKGLEESDKYRVKLKEQLSSSKPKYAEFTDQIMHEETIAAQAEEQCQKMYQQWVLKQARLVNVDQYCQNLQKKESMLSRDILMAKHQLRGKQADLAQMKEREDEMKLKVQEVMQAVEEATVRALNAEAELARCQKAKCDVSDKLSSTTQMCATMQFNLHKWNAQCRAT